MTDKSTSTEQRSSHNLLNKYKNKNTLKVEYNPWAPIKSALKPTSFKHDQNEERPVTPDWRTDNRHIRSPSVNEIECSPWARDKGGERDSIKSPKAWERQSITISAFNSNINKPIKRYSIEFIFYRLSSVNGLSYNNKNEREIQRKFIDSKGKYTKIYSLFSIIIYRRYDLI